LDSMINANILVGGTSRKAAVVAREVAEGLRFACGQYGSFTVFAVSLRFTAFRRILVGKLSGPLALPNGIVSLLSAINVKNFHGSLTTVVRAHNDNSKTANITDTIFDRTYWYSPYKRRRFENHKLSCLQNDRTNERMTENDHITYALLTEVIIIIMIIIIIIYYRPRDRVKIDRQHIFN